MAEESTSSGERTEEPTAKRREDFRKKGQVAQSREVQTAAIFTLMLLFWVLYLPRFWDSFTELIFALWQSSGQYDLTVATTLSLSSFLVQKLAILLAPLFVLVLVVGFFSSVFQFGWLLTAKPLIPDFSKLNPIAGAARFVSRRSLVELLKSLVKVGLVAWVGYSTILDNFEQALVLVDTSITQAIAFIGRIALIILAKICGILILIAFIDFLFVRWEMEQKMKMTKQEVKEEFKETEGDPHVRAQIRSIQQEMARRRMMADVPTADVVVTNPTHISVAIRYDRKEMDAPLVIAKGSDLIAMKIREIARDNDIPLVENPPVARLLHKVDIGENIPEDLFTAVAEILAYVYTLKGNT